MEKINPNSISFIYTEQLYSLPHEQVTFTKSDDTESPHISQPSLISEIKIEGSGINKILILNNETADLFINSNDKVLLSKIIGATNNKLEECSLVNVCKTKPSLASLVKQTGATKIISFGINLFELEVRDKNPLKYELSDIGDNVMIIPADSLKDIGLNKEKKTAFWLALKRLFNV